MENEREEKGAEMKTRREKWQGEKEEKKGSKRDEKNHEKMEMRQKGRNDKEAVRKLETPPLSCSLTVPVPRLEKGGGTLIIFDMEQRH